MDEEQNGGYNFAWDSAKAESNVAKHDVSFEEARSVFRDPLAGFLADEFHTEEEARGILIGVSSSGRLLFVSFTVRGTLVRIISARRATPKERKKHEQERYD